MSDERVEEIRRKMQATESSTGPWTDAEVSDLLAALAQVERERDHLRELHEDSDRNFWQLSGLLNEVRAEAERLSEVRDALQAENARLYDLGHRLEDEYEWQAIEDCACHCCQQRVARAKEKLAALGGRTTERAP